MLNVLQLARFVVGLAWIYHGIFPKLLQIAPLERVMTASLGLSEHASYLVTKTAGVGECLFGLVFILCYRVKWVQWLNLLGLLGLLLFTLVLTPAMLVEAFNPVTTNIPLMVLGYLLLQQIDDQPAKRNSIETKSHQNQATYASDRQ